MNTSRRLQVGLGLVWIADAALQCQPFMFTSRFADEVLRASGDGQPGLVAAPARLAADVVASAPALFNAAFIGVQLAIGMALLFRRSVRAGLIGSVVWGLAVWWLGEGLGGAFSGHMMLLTGGPGAALVYAIVAVAAWPTNTAGADRARRTGVIAWVAVWVVGSVFQLLPGQNSGTAIASAIDDAAGDAPAWLHGSLAHVVSDLPRGTAIAVALAAVELLVGLLALVPGTPRRIAVGTGLTLAALFFVAGQSLGELTTGSATDPNTAPVLVLLALAFVGGRRTPSLARAPRLSTVRIRTAVETPTS